MIGQKDLRKYTTVLIYILPTMIGVLLINVYPILYNVYISLTNRSLYHFDNYKFIGLRNYVRLFEKLVAPEALIALGKLLLCVLPLLLCWRLARRYLAKTDKGWINGGAWGLAAVLGIGLWEVLDGPGAIAQLKATGDFFIVMGQTIAYVVACVPFFFIVGLIFALLLNSKYVRGKAIARVLLIVPWAVPYYVSAMTWRYFFQQDFGTINQVLRLFGIEGPAWLRQPLTAFIATVIPNIWMSYPFFMVTILGALQSIPTELYEAAEMDGASWWRKLTSITLPLIRPAVMPAIVLSSITTFQMFGTSYLITGGGPRVGAGKPGATEYVMVYAYRQAFQEQNFGRIGAFAVIIFIILFTATMLSMRYARITRGAYE